MSRLPDRFDLWVRKAKKSTDPVRQADYVLGALVGLTEWCFPNVGTREKPRFAEAEIEGEVYLIVGSDRGRIEEMQNEATVRTEPLTVITMSPEAAMTWCAEQRLGLLVNPSEDAALIRFAQLEAFHSEWIQRGGRKASGFWIPNLTSEEEDFWQQNGL